MFDGGRVSVEQLPYADRGQLAVAELAHGVPAGLADMPLARWAGDVVYGYLVKARDLFEYLAA